MWGGVGSDNFPEWRPHGGFKNWVEMGGPTRGLHMVRGETSSRGGRLLQLCVVFTSGSVQLSSVQSLSCVRLFATPWMAAHQASLSITNSRSLLKLMSIESVMPTNHLILCRPLLLPPSIFPSIRFFSSESVLHIRWPKYWSFSFSISPSPQVVAPFSPWVRSKATAFCETAPRPHPHGRLSSSLPSILRPLSCPQPPSPHWRGRGLSRELPRSLRGSGPKSGRVQPECSRAGSPAPGLPASSIFSGPVVTETDSVPALSFIPGWAPGRIRA